MKSIYQKTVLTLFALSFIFRAEAIDGLLVKTINYSLNDNWYKTVSSTVPVFSDCKSVYRTQAVFIAVVVGGLELDTEGKANAEYSITISNSKQSNYFSKKELPIVKQRTIDPKHLQLSEAVLKMAIKEGDPLGKYKIKVQIKDLVSGKSKTLKSEIKVVKLPSYSSFKINDEEAFGSWMENYYQSPTPETALSNYIFYAQSKLSENENSFLPIFNFMLEIFNNNPYLLEQIIACYDKQDGKTKIHLIYLLQFSDIDASEFLNQLEGMEQDALKEIKKYSIPNPYDEIKEPAQLDMLWSNFRANGGYQPILKLIQTLDYTKYQGEMEAYSKMEEKTPEARQKAIYDSIYDAVVWSFSSNCKQHTLVKKYALWALENEDLSEIQREELKKIMTNL
jgi:hypothetical protein